ncbi:hypothetical protein TSAR_016775 [Trichomalopsis sarcophagae]|uniref:F-box domain-containing protein n=1 Tax=Trichomalopsis sarcophagae TaxID=543379 RepID=A0A232EX46_9HYME|nr:hypothetical protein TSAR_016775 [Trichomalopsis sarcophagae]
MDSFHLLMTLINQHSPDDDQPDLDMLKNLPVEISQTILSKLDSDSLLNCALVSRKWLSICKSSRSLRQKVRLHIRSKENVRIINQSITNAPSTSNHSIHQPNHDTYRPSYRPMPPPTNNRSIVIFDDSSISNDTNPTSSTPSVSQQPPSQRRRSTSTKCLLKKTSCLRF